MLCIVTQYPGILWGLCIANVVVLLDTPVAR
jgi:hypothetical protein